MADKRRIKNNSEFYKKLHELEALDENWIDHLGAETVRNSGNYAGAGEFDDKLTNAENAKRTLQISAKLQEIRQTLPQEQHPWRTGAQRDAIRLKVTIYRNFGLSYPEISKILHEKPSTIRHSYKPFGKREKLKADYRLILRNDNGRHITQ